MYTAFYGLKAKPFEITPDPKFLFHSESHREALAHLTYAVREKKGFTVITGEVGTGKTTLVQTLLSRLNGNTRTAYLFNPKLGSTDFIHYICEDFGLKGQKRSKGQYLTQLHNYLLERYAQNENVVLIIDEAHTLDPKLLEEVRLLTNLETPKSKLLQVILIGQPELNNVLNDPQYRQLKQRISLRYHLQPLSRKDTKEFIYKRLRVAGVSDPYLFTPKALNEIYEYSKGIPRLINIICDNALLTGYANDQKIIGPRTIREVVKQLDGINKKRKNNRPVIFTILLMIIFTLSIFSLFLWKDSLQKLRWEITEQVQSIGRLIEKIYQETLRKDSNETGRQEVK